MHPTDADLVDIPTDKMELAYLEYRYACYEVLHRECVARGVLEALREPVTLDAFAERAGVVPAKKPVARLLLDVLVEHDDVRVVLGEPARYVASGRTARRAPDDELVVLATGKRSVDELAHGRSYSGILAALAVEGNPIAANYTTGSPPSIEEIFVLPYYRYCRLRAAREVTAAGSRILDLACGPGHGLRELAERTPDDQRTVLFGIELTEHYVAAALERNAGDGRVRVVRGDLQEPQDFLQEGFFDGATMMGAYHFLSRPDALWDTVARVLRPGGVFCLGYVQSQVDSADRALMDLRFALREPPVHRTTPARIRALAESRGLVTTQEWGLGIWKWYAFAKR
ncbi:class I SAM-dependent methyltransferase [Umezawaea sp. NPDC059074]|uniref:class I SAM-dependent methyltransferase n=1 Tax=Umezawaea sp. NPDC059074 TaxID=3346716 RepID=UPI003688FD76